MKKIARNIILLLSIIGSSTFIFLMAFLFVYALKYFRANFPLGYPRETIAFYTAMFVAMTTVIFQWIEGRINSIVESIKMLRQKGGIPNGKERRRK